EFGAAGVQVTAAQCIFMRDRPRGRCRLDADKGTDCQYRDRQTRELSHAALLAVCETGCTQVFGGGWREELVENCMGDSAAIPATHLGPPFDEVGLIRAPWGEPVFRRCISRTLESVFHLSRVDDVGT